MLAFDTNILVYATQPATEPKSIRAREVIGRAMHAGRSVLLLQTLSELANVTVRKRGMPARRVQALLDAWIAVMPVFPAEGDDLAAALGAVAQHRLAFWDAMLWATARRVGLRHLLTEDFQDGRELEGVRFLNPFADRNRMLLDQLL